MVTMFTPKVPDDITLPGTVQDPPLDIDAEVSFYEFKVPEDLYKGPITGEILRVFDDLKDPPELGISNLSFKTLLLANYSTEYLIKEYPELCKFYEITKENE